MITYDEVVAALYLMEITADLIVFETNQKIVHDYIIQQQIKDRRLKKIEELLGLYREKDKLRDELFNEYTSIYSTAQSLNKIVNDFKQIQEQINILEKELEELK